MIAYRTFAQSRGITVRGMTKAQEEIRRQAAAFIASELDDEDVVCITESALPSTWSSCLISVTVWYRAA